MTTVKIEKTHDGKYRVFEQSPSGFLVLAVFDTHDEAMQYATDYVFDLLLI